PPAPPPRRPALLPYTTLFRSPDQAAEAFTYMWRYSYVLRGLYETPALGDEEGYDAKAARKTADELIDAVRAEGRTILDEYESKKDRKSTRLNSSHVSISYAVF